MTSSVFAAMVENSRQGLPAISVTSQPGLTDESAEPHQGFSLRLRIFTADSLFGFNGGINLYRYADNNPMLFIDPFGLSACYKDLVVRVLNYYDKFPFCSNDYVLRSAFEFFKTIPNGPELKIFNHFSGGNIAPLGTIDRTSTSWTIFTDFVFNSYRREDNENEKIANIIISNTNWGSEDGARAGLTDRYGRNQALVSGNYSAHEDPIKLGWTVAHETGHIILGLDEDYGFFNQTLMTPGAWPVTSFNESQIKSITTKLKK